MENKNSEQGGTANDGKPAKVVKPGWSGIRLVALVTGVAVVSLIAGIALMQFIVSPAEVAARTEAPEAGPVTAVIEKRIIENTIVARGEVTYADSQNVEIDQSVGEGRAIITGHVPEVGKQFNSGNIALEVSGRPVIVLPGELPAYRSLNIGMRGPDVVQLKKALDGLGLYPGSLESDIFEWDTATAVGQLYENEGYDPSNGGKSAQEAVRLAQASVRSAEIAVSQAEAAWQQAANGGATDLSAQNAELEIARSGLESAQGALTDAQQAALPTLPAGEVLYLTSLPRRVDDVYVRRGDALTNPAMIVSGAKLTIVGTFSKQDADLLQKGTVAEYAGPDGTLEAKVSKIEAPRSGGSSVNSGEEGGEGGTGGGASSDRYTVYFDPGKLTDEQISQLRGANLRLRIPVASTDKEVLAVPLAALTTGADGSNRVELLVPDHDDPFKTEIVNVKSGLVADGFVEITSVDQRIEPGAKVVVGR